MKEALNLTVVIIINFQMKEALNLIKVIINFPKKVALNWK